MNKDELLAKLQRETSLMSSTSKMMTATSFKQFCALAELNKEDVVSYLLRALAVEDFYQMVIIALLHEITGENPVPQHHKGKTDKMVSDWIGWGIEEGYFDTQETMDLIKKLAGSIAAFNPLED